MTALTATERRSHLLSSVSHGGAYDVINLTSTVEVPLGATGRTINFGYIPSNARLLNTSRIYNDDLSNNAATMDIGIGAVNGNLVNADTVAAIGNGFALNSAGSDSPMISDAANIGLPAWDLLTSETSDPGGVLMVYGTILDATTTVAGTVTVEMYYTVD